VNNFIVRTLTGIVFAISIIGSILVSHYLFSLLFLVVTIFTMLEFYKLADSGLSIKIQTKLGVFTGSMLFILSSLSSLGLISTKFLAIIFLLTGLLFIAEMYRNKSNPFLNISMTLAGVFYIALPFSMLNFFYTPYFDFSNGNYEVLIGFFLILWVNDSLAYLVGSSIGKHRLFERISPKKSWEGSIGGFAFGLLTAWGISFFFKELELNNWLVIAAIIMIFGTFGDLVESLFKRSLNIKDSGSFLPGHGGLLDRFDAVLLAAPAVFVYLIIIN
jgi:phosphatidate cytidylyltransferase